MDPLSNKFVMPIDSYDVTLLPPDKRDPNSPDFPLAISKQLTEELSAFGAKARIIVDPEFIEIEWDPTSRIDIVGAAVKLLQSGNYRSGVPLLRNILANDTDNTVVLFNLGMALSDLGELGDAITYLRRLVKLQQDNPTLGSPLVSQRIAMVTQNSLWCHCVSRSNWYLMIPLHTAIWVERS